MLRWKIFKNVKSLLILRHQPLGNNEKKYSTAHIDHDYSLSGKNTNTDGLRKTTDSLTVGFSFVKINPFKPLPQLP
jgi:hypothetical protein